MAAAGAGAGAGATAAHKRGRAEAGTAADDGGDDVVATIASLLRADPKPGGLAPFTAAVHALWPPVGIATTDDDSGESSLVTPLAAAASHLRAVAAAHLYELATHLAVRPASAYNAMAAREVSRFAGTVRRLHTAATTAGDSHRWSHARAAVAAAPPAIRTAAHSVAASHIAVIDPVRRWLLCLDAGVDIGDACEANAKAADDRSTAWRAEVASLASQWDELADDKARLDSTLEELAVAEMRQRARQRGAPMPSTLTPADVIGVQLDLAQSGREDVRSLTQQREALMKRQTAAADRGLDLKHDAATAKLLNRWSNLGIDMIECLMFTCRTALRREVMAALVAFDRIFCGFVQAAVATAVATAAMSGPRRAALAEARAKVADAVAYFGQSAPTLSQRLTEAEVAATRAVASADAEIAALVATVRDLLAALAREAPLEVRKAVARRLARLLRAGGAPASVYGGGSAADAAASEGDPFAADVLSSILHAGFSVSVANWGHDAGSAAAAVDDGASEAAATTLGFGMDEVQGLLVSTVADLPTGPWGGAEKAAATMAAITSTSGSASSGALHAHEVAQLLTALAEGLAAVRAGPPGIAASQSPAKTVKADPAAATSRALFDLTAVLGPHNEPDMKRLQTVDKALLASVRRSAAAAASGAAATSPASAASSSPSNGHADSAGGSGAEAGAGAAAGRSSAKRRRQHERAARGESDDDSVIIDSDAEVEADAAAATEAAARAHRHSSGSSGGTDSDLEGGAGAAAGASKQGNSCIVQ